MARKSYQKLRLQEFNDFDMERLLKGVIDSLEIDNSLKEALLDTSSELLDNETRFRFAQSIENNAAEIARVTSILTHTDDIYSYFINGPLFRKDRDVK